MTDGRMDGWIDGQTDAAVIHPTGTAAVPRPAGQPLPELGPGSKPQKDQHYGLSEYAQMSGTQIPVQSRQHRPRTHDAVHLPWPDHHCIEEFQFGSECSQRSSLKSSI